MKSGSKKNQKEIKKLSTAEDLKDLTRDELSGTDTTDSDLAASSTDEDEDEGLGDGNITRSDDDILGKD